jgi:hypothetical protein
MLNFVKILLSTHITTRISLNNAKTENNIATVNTLTVAQQSLQNLSGPSQDRSRAIPCSPKRRHPLLPNDGILNQRSRVNADLHFGKGFRFNADLHLGRFEVSYFASIFTQISLFI